MEIKDYNIILDSMQRTGIYVIREDNHQILYFNKWVKEFAPDIEIGMVCRGIWGQSCLDCPLLSMGNQEEGRITSYETPFQKAVDIMATKIMWKEKVPAFLVTITPHAERISYTYDIIMRINLSSDSFEVMKSNREDFNDYAVQCLSLSQLISKIIESGSIYENDLKRFREFAKIENLRKELESEKKKFACTYRSKSGNGYRWHTLEIVPDYDYSKEWQAAMLYVEDVHDIYSRRLNLEETDSRNREIINILGEVNFGIYIIDLHTGMMNPVRVAEDIDDITNQEILDWQEILENIVTNIHPEYRKKMIERYSLESLRESWKKGKKKVEMICQRMLYGNYHYISVTAYFHEKREDNCYAILAMQDVDKHTRLEMKRTQNDKRMAAIIKSMYKVMTTVYLDTGMCESIYLNEPGTASKANQEDYDCYIQKVMDTIHEEDSYEFQTVFSLERLRQKAEEVEDYEEIICRYRVKEPSLVWIESQILFVRHDEKTVVVNILDRDITREKLKEVADIRARLESNRIIHSLSRLFFATRYIDLEADTCRSVARIDKGGNVMGTAINYNEDLGIYSQNSIHPDDRMEYIEKMNCQNLLNNLSLEHPFIAMEYRRIKKRDEDVIEENGWIRATVILVNMEDGVPKKALYVEQDVTESKEEQEREHRMLKEAYDAANHANKAKSEFLSRVSHDIRTPMNAIIGMTEIAGNHLDEKERVADCLNKIRVSSNHLLSLINEVLDMSAIESGKIDLAEENFKVSELVQNVLTMIQPAVQAKGHTLEFHSAKLEHDEVSGDAMRLQQVFMNILGNAVKYTPPGGKIELEVLEKSHHADGFGCYEFVFRDNGMGMTEEYQKQMFEPFSRAQDTRINKIEGTGLGMTIALNIIRMMNGDISVKSEVNEGSCFTVSVFLKQQDKQPEDMGNDREIITVGQEADDGQNGKLSHGEIFQGKRILLVDDIEINREIAMEIIGDAGVTVESAENGKEALEKFMENGEGYYDLIFMDVQMPLMNGYEATKAIRKAERADAATIPIIAMTANAFTEDVMDSRKAGMNEHIPKPLNVEQVIGCMKRWFE